MESASDFSWSNSIRVFVYVNVYRFAVTVYGLPNTNRFLRNQFHVHPYSRSRMRLASRM